MEVLNYDKFRVTNEMQASKGKRFANLIIDRILFYGIFFLFGTVAYVLAEFLGSEAIYDFLISLDNINPLLDIFVTSLIYVVFYTILESLTQRTIGKLVTQTKVVLENGEKPTADVILLRSLARVIPFEPFSFLGNSPRGWHDTLTKTCVVDTKIFDEQKRAFEDFKLLGKKEE